MTIATNTELPAAARFSVRIDPGEYKAGLSGMQELSLLTPERATKFA
jgi:hypothetical protein